MAMHGTFTRIRIRILSIVLLAIIPAIGLIFYSTAERKRQISEEIESNALRLSRFLAGNLERDLQQGQGYLRSVAKTMDFPGLRPENCRAAFAELLGDSSVYANMGIAGADGRVACSAAPVPRDSGLGKLEWFQKAGVPGSLAVGFDYRGVLSHQASINLGMALPEGPGRKKGDILFAVMDLDWLNKLAEKSQLPEGSALSVTNKKGDAVVRYPDPDKWVGKPYPQALSQETRFEQGEGVRIAKGIDGVERLYAFSAVQGRGSFVVQIGIRLEVVYARVNHILYQQLAALGMVALLAILAALFGADVFLLKQVNALIAATRRLAAGDLTARSDISYDMGELGDLARAFDNMAEKLEWREAQLRESESERADPNNHLPDLIEIIPQAVLLLDGKLRIEASNRRARTLFGFDDSGMVGREFRELCPDAPLGESPEDPPERIGGRLRESGSSAVRQDGTRIPIELAVSKANLNRRTFFVVLLRDRDGIPARKTE